VNQVLRDNRSAGWRVMAAYGGRRAVAPAGGFVEPSPELLRSVRSRRAAVFQRMDVDGRPLLVVGMPVTYVSGTDGESRLSGTVLYLEVPQTTELRYVRAMVDGIERATLVALGLAVVPALLAASGVLRPVRALRRATRRMAAGHLDVRLEVTGTDELADLSQSFNESAAELERTVRELRRLEAQGRRFVADVSHELRTPLAAMSAVTDVLDLEGETGEALRLISDGTNRLSDLVNDLMEISRFDAGVAELNRDEIDLAESVRRTVASRWPRERVEIRLPETGVLRARVDPRRLDVVTANLVGNALRHGEPPVRVTMEMREEDGTGRAWAVVQVADDGPGIAEEALPHIFERFYKASTSRGRSESSGLGLAITAENVRLHGGRIRAANLPGGGAVFTVELPLHDVGADVPPGADADSAGSGSDNGKGTGFDSGNGNGNGNGRGAR
jgi:two-component system sensor histidine kinase MtrB